ncbi:hypothetical protein OROGR_010875 [Orobanche gracilis]
MERANSEDGNGGVKLPIGFRFHPTDEELLVHYLKRKVFSLPLPAGLCMNSALWVPSASPTPYSPQKIMIQVGDWVVCRVYQRKSKRRNQGRVDQVVAGGKKPQNLVISFDKRNSAVSPSSSSSSSSSSSPPSC